jgi:Skp family chaperone for outer membrane proteins
MQKGNAGAMKMNPSQSSSMKGGAMLGAPGQTGNAMQPKSNSPASKETFLIVEVGKDLQVVSKSGLKDLKKRIEDDFKRATQDYQNAKKDKKNKDAKLEKPEKKTVKELKSGIKTQEKAQEELQKLQEERNKKKS